MASGKEKIFSTLLVILKDEIVHCVHHIFTLSLTSGTLPTDWKSATVTPNLQRTWKPTSGYQLPANLTFECTLKVPGKTCVQDTLLPPGPVPANPSVWIPPERLHRTPARSTGAQACHCRRRR